MPFPTSLHGCRCQGILRPQSLPLLPVPRFRTPLLLPPFPPCPNLSCSLAAPFPSHLPSPEAGPIHQVLGIIHRYPNVVLTLAGHTHRDNYHQDTAGVHHRVIKVPAPPPTYFCDVWGAGNLFGQGAIIATNPRAENGGSGETATQTLFTAWVLSIGAIWPHGVWQQTAGTPREACQWLSSAAIVDPAILCLPPPPTCSDSSCGPHRES